MDDKLTWAEGKIKAIREAPDQLALLRLMGEMLVHISEDINSLEETVRRVS